MPRRWMADAKLRALFNSDLTYDEIAEVNERAEGWRPSRAAVMHKLEKVINPETLPLRRTPSRNLIPWKISAEHNQDRLRYMLQAEARRRAGKTLTSSDQNLTSMLHDLLFGRGKLMVVGYHPEVGFYLTERTDGDTDIIRSPRQAGALKKPVDYALRTLEDEELADFAAAEGLRPELLENAGRDRAADFLRRESGERPLHADLDTEDDPELDAVPPRTAPRRRRTG